MRWIKHSQKNMDIDFKKEYKGGNRLRQNELDNGNLTTIQLVDYLRISYFQKVNGT